jgi:FkbM family methyltransferase
MSVINTLGFIINHPLSRRKRIASIIRWLKWQIGIRLVPGPVVVSFVNDSVLLVERGMTGATGNIYTGLHEFEDMAFVLHMLRKGDLFVDIGANVGSYTILASGAVGAECISIEPIPATYGHLMRNIGLNNIGGIVDTRNIGVGPGDGFLPFTTGEDTMNRVLGETVSNKTGTVMVKVSTLDNVVGDRLPRLIKIDVEGFESSVIASAHNVLSKDSLVSVIVELNGSGGRYGFTDAGVHSKMLDFGFRPFIYEPFERKLSPLEGKNEKSGNTLYIRDLNFVRDRVATAQKFRIRDDEI